MTIKDIYKLLSSGMSSDKALASSYLEENEELFKDFIIFYGCVGEFPFSQDKKIIELTGKELNYWWNNGQGVFDGNHEFLLKQITKIWNKS